MWNRVTINREQRKSTRYYIDEMHLLLKEEQTAAYTVEIWKRFRKWGGVPTGITQNVKDLLSSREVENIFENSDYVYMLNQASGDRQILAKQLNISPASALVCDPIRRGRGAFVLRQRDPALRRPLPQGYGAVQNHHDTSYREQGAVRIETRKDVANMNNHLMIFENRGVRQLYAAS